MISRYGIFCTVVAVRSFTRAAEVLGYSQSAVSQTIKTLEQEVGTTLLRRSKDGIDLTEEGSRFFPYLRAIWHAEEALHQKEQEMRSLTGCTVRIGTFTSVSRNLLPQLMKRFKLRYPEVSFVLSQGEYTGIEQWIKDGTVDFGFVDAEAVSGVQVRPLYQDEMRAVLPPEHPLAQQHCISLEDLSREPFILLDEGRYSVPMQGFQRASLTPRIEYQVYDDYTILAMVRQGLGVSTMYQLVLAGFESGLVIRPIHEPLERTVALAWRSWDTMSYGAREFARFVQEHAQQEILEQFHGQPT